MGGSPSPYSNGQAPRGKGGESPACQVETEREAAAAGVWGVPSGHAWLELSEGSSLKKLSTRLLLESASPLILQRLQFFRICSYADNSPL